MVYGDYDVDGLSGSTILQRALLALGARAEVFIPHRDRDGYGLNTDVLRALAEQEAGLVITVDCEVTAAAEVAAANAIGLDIVVTDHHDVPAELPLAVAVVNPHRPDCPTRSSSSRGLASRSRWRRRWCGGSNRPPAPARPALLQLAALGTVSDVMPLVGENRAIVRHGLRALNERPIAGLSALVRSAGLTRPWIEAEDIAFRLAPRLNARGRSPRPPSPSDSWRPTTRPRPRIPRRRAGGAQRPAPRGWTAALDDARAIGARWRGAARRPS